MSRIGSVLQSVVISLLVGVSVTSCSQLASTPLQTRQDLLTAGEYVLQPGDQIEIRPIQDAPYGAVWVVAPDGRIAIPGIKGLVQAAGQTIRGLSDTLNRLYAEAGVLKEPFFTVNLLNVANQTVFVGGEVLHPGIVPVAGSHRSIMQAIMARGGPLSTAYLGEVVVIRVMPDGELHLFSVDLREVLSGTDLSQNVSLTPMDVVMIPKSRIAEVDLWMDQYVRKALPIPLNLALQLSNVGGYIP
jgi:protein involved in polysaccharide export with SLBB domain